jgi:uncharacterized protein
MREISAEQVKRKLKLLNPHWQHEVVGTDLRKEKKRKYFELFFPLVQSTVNRAIVLMGPRRVGKTVILWQTIQELMDKGVRPEKILYVSLDTPLIHTYSLEALTDLFIQIFNHDDLKGTVIIFDEIQYLKNWDVQLKVLVDTYPHTKFIASGSAASALVRKSRESGAGRFTDFMLPPVTFYEYLDLLDLMEPLVEFKGSEDNKEYPVPRDIEKLNHEFINYLNFGGFPEAIFNEEVRNDPQRFLRSDIIDKVLLRDLPSLYGILDTQELNRLFSALAYQTGSEISYEKLSMSSGVAKNTLKRYIEYLEAAFLIRTVNRVDDSGKRFKRTNFFKVYLTNPSMYAAIYDMVSEEDPTTLGNLVETAIFSQWLHSPSHLMGIYYARWKGGKGEVDLVHLDDKLKIDFCLEVKWSDRHVSNLDELKNLIYFCERNKVPKANVTTKSIFKTINTKKVEIIFSESAIQCLFIGHFLIHQKRA